MSSSKHYLRFCRTAMVYGRNPHSPQQGRSVSITGLMKLQLGPQNFLTWRRDLQLWNSIQDI